MAHYDTPVRDWFGGICINRDDVKNHGAHPQIVGGVKFAKGVPHNKSQKFGIRTLQQGVTQFSRKKKNGCRLASTPQIKRSIAAGQAKLGQATYRLAFPKINLKNPAETPKVVVTVPKPKVQSTVKGEKFALNTTRY